ncbi:MAG: SUMF1/EgtB/PvdO family nonheme iron enzyme [Bacteroidetes bacterium]|nr:SUMF1/EgtB/PvdO family nonheme iron enzyme [Bacteroidota bacterium]
MKIFIRLYTLVFLLAMVVKTNAQEIKKLDTNNGLQVVSLNGQKIFLPANTPLLSYEMDKMPVIPKPDDNSIQIIVLPVENFSPGYKAVITFKNISSKKINIRNIVPLGTSNKSSYITGLGDYGLSRTHLFIPGRLPVNCILPDNAWNLGFSTMRLDSNQSICALMRRDNKSAVKTSISRFENILEPGGSISYNLYIDFFSGEWQEGLRKMLQERYLYDVENFDNSLFERSDLKWIRHSYVMHLIMNWDKIYYDIEDGKFHLNEFLMRGQKLYGGDEVVGLWPTWPTLGIDQRNQFDMFRDLPGGLEQFKKTVAEAHALGTKIFVAYNPWDESTRAEDHLKGLANVLKNTNADGAILDTKGGSNKELQDAADAVKKGVIMYSEGMAVPKDMQGIVSGRVHNALYYPPLLSLTKFIKPDFAIFRVAEVYKEPIKREYATSFFNGYGTELNIFAPGQPSWVEEQYKYLGRTSRILRENTYNFTEKNYVPLIPTAFDSIYVNKWPKGEKTIYTVFSLIPQGFKDYLFEVDTSTNSHYIDLWHHKNLQPKRVHDKMMIEVETDAFNKTFLGTNNEGEVDCIAQLPNLLNTSLSGDTLFVQADRGDSIKVWAGNPDYEKTPHRLAKGSYKLKLLDVFGRYEGKFVVQLFDKGILLDENLVEIIPGTPRLASRNSETKKASGKEKDMVKIPAGSFEFKTTHGDEFIPYPKDNEGKTFKMTAYMMDKYPVTNAQYYEFIKATKYHPMDGTNFLKHWENGKPKLGEENYPVVYVSYEDAKAYSKWAGKRLPTEIEWQYAAQTSDGREWPWAKETNSIIRKEEPVTETLTIFKIQGIDSTQANTGNGRPDPVGKYKNGVNPNGLYDLTGSVWQLTNDLYKNGSYAYIIMKGGSYYNPSSSWWYVQGGPRELHFRQYLLRVSQGFERNATVGFRCVKDL